MSCIHYSIGVPVYNQAHTIGDTIESILSQTEPFDEVLVCDNYSTDGTSDVLKSFGQRIRIVKPDEHLSMVSNWNFTVSQMDCDWFSLLSGDDYLYPGFCCSMRTAICRWGGRASLFRAGFDVVDERRRIVRHEKFRWRPQRISYPLSIFEQLDGPRVSFAAFAASRKLWEKAGGFPHNLTLGQDWGFWLRMAREGDIVCAESKPVAQYTAVERPQEDSARLPLWLTDSCELYQWIVDEGIYSFSKKAQMTLYRNRFLRHLKKFRRYSDQEKEKSRPVITRLGSLAGYSQKAVESRIQNGRTLGDWLFRRRFRAFNASVRSIAWLLGFMPAQSAFNTLAGRFLEHQMDAM